MQRDDGKRFMGSMVGIIIIIIIVIIVIIIIIIVVVKSK